jgi:hypothetical protein
MSEKVIIEEGNGEEMEFDTYIATSHDYIASATNALNTIAEIDMDMLWATNKSDAKRVNRIRRQSLRILSYCINELYEEIFDTDDSDD